MGQTYERSLISQTIVVGLTETQVTMTVHSDSIPTIQESIPSTLFDSLSHVDESIVESEERSVVGTGSSNRTHHFVSFDVAVHFRKKPSVPEQCEL